MPSDARRGGIVDQDVLHSTARKTIGPQNDADEGILLILLEAEALEEYV